MFGFLETAPLQTFEVGIIFLNNKIHQKKKKLEFPNVNIKFNLLSPLFLYLIVLYL